MRGKAGVLLAFVVAMTAGNYAAFVAPTRSELISVYQRKVELEEEMIQGQAEALRVLGSRRSCKDW